MTPELMDLELRVDAAIAELGKVFPPIYLTIPEDAGDPPVPSLEAAVLNACAMGSRLRVENEALHKERNRVFAVRHATRHADTGRRGDWMQTHTGRAFWPLDPRPEDVDIEDIAHALAQQNRYAGHCPWPYSVAAHSVYVSRRAARLAPPGREKQCARWGLLHDATEAYLVDVPSPIKRFLTEYAVIEADLMHVIAQRFGLEGEMPEEVKRADADALATEASILFPTRPRDWHLTGHVDTQQIYRLSWIEARNAFLTEAAVCFPAQTCALRPEAV